MVDHHTDVVDRRLAALIPGLPGREVVDVGGGSGTRAVPLARLGCRVTVVDSSTDALASLSRRAAEAGVGALIHPIQADADQLATVVGRRSADLVLLHGIVDDVDDPAVVVAAAARALRPGGRVSVLVAGRLAALIRQAFAGRYGQAREILRSGEPRAGWPLPSAVGESVGLPMGQTVGQVSGEPVGSAAGEAVGQVAGRSDRSAARGSADGLYDVAALTDLLSAAGLRVESVAGVGVVSGLAGAAGRTLIEGADLDALEDALGAHPVGRDLAADLHAIAVSDEPPSPDAGTDPGPPGDSGPTAHPVANPIGVANPTGVANPIGVADPTGVAHPTGD